jgi:hypothetical protein
MMKGLILFPEKKQELAQEILPYLDKLSFLSEVKSKDFSSINPDQLPEAGLVLLMMSPELLESGETSTGDEALETIKAWFDGETRHLVLVMTAACEWEEAGWLGLQVIPANEVPLESWKNKGEAFEKAIADLKALMDRNTEIRENPEYFEERVKKMKAEGGPSAMRIAGTLVWKSVPKGVKWGVGAVLAGLAAYGAYQIF